MPNAPREELRAAVQEWYRQALPFIQTKDFDTTWCDFIISLEVCKPVGQSFDAAAAAAAAEGPPAIAKRLGYDGNMSKLTAICWQLARQWGDRPFPLGCKKAGEYLGVSTIQAWRFLKTLEFEGVIELAAKANRLKQKAKEWRFILEQGS